ncbi:ABC transporter permease [Tumebacillus flagellatus]|uniref:ABC transmembrane type-1 domain-containing protein n=1 Tax=Tumebacillus flagellatus TaxID=1157490 RepID=A0A074M8K5_9BACL|nr:ABC transporter permease [Tumebacillus flagellatus]KEO82317.1 hypothetical protein EL26_16175 [Tumebacillus flagellatus]
MKPTPDTYSPWRYRLAWGLLLLLVFLVFFGHHLMPYGIDPADRVNLMKGIDPATGKVKMLAPPFGPSWQHWLGTDHRGYDLLSLLLNGAKYTLGFAFFATAVRFLLALPGGLFSGATGRGRGVISFLNVVLSAVPPLVFIFPTLFGSAAFLSPDQTVVLLFAMIVCIGVPQIANQFANRSQFYAERLYIDAARTMGASTRGIVWRHILPHMRPELLFAFLSDFIGVLFLIGQLSILSVFLGGGETFMVDDGPPPVILYLTKNGEWGSLVAYGAKYIRSYWWLVAGAGVFFAGAVLILQFFSKELQRYLSSPAARHQAKPILQNRPLQAAVGGFSALCLAAVLLLPDHAPQQKNKDSAEAAGSPPPRTAAMPAFSSSAAALPSEDEIMRSEFQADATNFFQGLKTDWTLAAMELTSPPYNPSRKYETPKQPIPPFDQWIAAMKERNLSYSNIGKISDGPVIKTDWGAPIETKQVEVYMHGPDNREEIWTLYMNGKPREPNKIVSGKPLP